MSPVRRLGGVAAGAVQGREPLVDRGDLVAGVPRHPLGGAIECEPVALDVDGPGGQVLNHRPEPRLAEKFHAMVKLGLLNSRLKYFYDVWVLSRQGDFIGPVLADAVRRTFKNWDT